MIAVSVHETGDEDNDGDLRMDLVLEAITADGCEVPAWAKVEPPSDNDSAGDATLAAGSSTPGATEDDTGGVLGAKTDEPAGVVAARDGPSLNGVAVAAIIVSILFCIAGSALFYFTVLRQRRVVKI